MISRRVLNAVKLLVPLVIAFFLARVIRSNWEQVQQANWSFRPDALLLSFVLCSPWFVMRPFGWNVLLNRFGRHVPFAAAFRVARHAELSRYVPGGVWQFVSRVYLIQKWHVTATACLAATMVDLVLATLASMIPALWTLSDLLPDLGRFHRVMLVAFPIASIAVIHPRIFNAWAAFLAGKLKQPYTRLEIGFPRIAGIWAMYVLGWLALCAGVAVFIYGLIELPPEHAAFVGSSYAAAWLVGILAMIAPAGMGIRELALGLMLAKIVGEGPAFTLAVGIRFWLLAVEMAWVGLGSLMPRPTPPEE